jgi:photosystem II stability/assembly factor-like uncharacterized protein
MGMPGTSGSRLGGTMGKKYKLAIICVLIFAAEACLKLSPSPINTPKDTTKHATLTSTPTATSTLVPTSMPTPIPLTWQQIADGQEFERDTVTAFATDKNDPNVIYASMKNTGIFKTSDGGLSWQHVLYGLTTMQVVSLLIDPQNPTILYAGTMDGVYKTEDGGKNWHRIGAGTYLLMDSQDSSHIYARDENGIYETKDLGKNWTIAYALKTNCPGTVSSWAIHPTDSKMIFIGSEDKCGPGIYQSTDHGHTWKLIGGVWERPSLNALAIGLNAQGDFSVYSRNGISHDGGETWYFTDAFGCDALIPDPEHPATIYCAYEAGGLMAIKGQGSTWQRAGLEASKITAISIDYVNGTKRIIVGGTRLEQNTKDGIFISEDGGVTWAEGDSGLGMTRSELKVDPVDGNKLFIAAYYEQFENDWNTTACALYRSQDLGKNWSLIRLADWCGPAFDAANVIHIIQNGALQRSWDGGETWSWEPEGKLLSSGHSLDFNAHYRLPGWETGNSQSVSANPYMDGLIYSVGNTIYYSPDSGASWQKSVGSEGSLDGRLFYTDQSKMMFDIGRYHQAFSTDNGMTWQNCGEDVTTSQSDTRLALDLQGSHLYLATPGQGVLVSTDKCQSWQPSNQGLDNLFANTIAIDPNDSNIVYAGTDDGAYVSFDSGETWSQINDGLPITIVVYSIVVDKDSNVYAATPYGIFKLESK